MASCTVEGCDKVSSILNIIKVLGIVLGLYMSVQVFVFGYGAYMVRDTLKTVSALEDALYAHITYNLKTISELRESQNSHKELDDFKFRKIEEDIKALKLAQKD